MHTNRILINQIKTYQGRSIVWIINLLMVCLLVLFSNQYSYAAGTCAYVYSTDTTSANDFKSFLDAGGCVTTLIDMSSVSGTSFLSYDVIIIGSDTGNLGTWGDSASVNVINDSGRPILALGEGGYAFLGKLSLSTGYPNGWHGTLTQIYVVDPHHPVFHHPVPIPIPPDNILTVYSSTNSVGIYLPVIPPDIFPIGREVADTNHYTILQEKGKYFFWGFTGTSTDMTAEGQDLFMNIMRFLNKPLKCDIQLNKISYVSGDKVIAKVFRIANNNPHPMPVEVKVWLEAFMMPPVSLINKGADGKLILPADFEKDFGPISLLTITNTMPSGMYGVNCRMLDPVTGALLEDDMNQFNINP